MPRGSGEEEHPADVIGSAAQGAGLSVEAGAGASHERRGQARGGCAGAKARAEGLTAGERRRIGKKGRQG